MSQAQLLRFRRVFGSANKLHLELAWLSIAGAAILALNVLIGIAVARYLDTTDYGRFSYFVNVFGVLRLVASLGMTSHIAFQLAQDNGRGLAPRHSFYSMLTVRLTTLGGFGFLAILIGYLRGDLILIISGSASSLALINDFGVGALQGLKLSKQVIATLATQPVTYALGTVVVVANRWPITGLYWSYCLSFVLAIGLATACLLRAMGVPKFALPGWDVLRASIRYAGGMYLHAILGTIFTSFATLYLGSLGRFTDAALITIPLNLVFTASALANMVMATAYFPRQTELFAHLDFAGAQTLLRYFFGLATAATMLLAFTLLFYPHIILSLLYGQRYLTSAPILASLAFTTLFYTLQTVLTFTLVARRRLRDSIAGAVIPNLVLIGFVSLVGSANDALILMSLAHCAAAAFGFLWQLQKFDSEISALLKQLGLAAVVATALLGPVRLVLNDKPQKWLLVLPLLALIAAVYSGWVWHSSRQNMATTQSLSV